MNDNSHKCDNLLAASSLIPTTRVSTDVDDVIMFPPTGDAKVDFYCMHGGRLLSYGCLLFLCRQYNMSCALFAGQLEYQAQSPDEAALVSAARNFGFVFMVCHTWGSSVGHGSFVDRVQG